MTGEARVDQLLQQYELYTRAEPSVRDFIVLHARRPLNLSALAKRFAGIEGVREIYPNVLIGGGHDIYSIIDARGIALRYMFAWGDCPSGCLASHYWQFFVHEDRRVEFRGEWGSPLPR